VSSAQAALLEPYVPRLVVTWLQEDPTARWKGIEGSLAFVDISGFTQLTERLARKGRVGAEEMSDILNATFADLLAVAYKDGAGLVKWGGDAVLLLFEGEDHAQRACRAAARMRSRLATIGRIGSGSGRVVLRMSVGVHSGLFHFFLVGDPELHRELIISGPAASRCAEVEAIADADEVGISAETAALLPPHLVGPEKDGAFLLAAEPELDDLPIVMRGSSEGVDIAGLLPVAVRAHLLSADGEPEHRRIAVAFVQFSGTDALLRDEGPEALADALDECMRNVQEATARNGVTFFETDINRDGGKVMLTAGAPASLGNDEERMLRATRRIVERIGRLPVRVGVNCGPVFAGDFGPPFRRTFSVKGDAINLAARVMGKAQPGQLLATTAVLERSQTRFELEPLAPFMVKGKSAPVEAASVGPMLAERGADAAAGSLVGREPEMAVLRQAAASTVAGDGQVVDLVGEPGIGKSRLVQELLVSAGLPAHVTGCDQYERETAYWPMRALLRSVLGVAADAQGGDVLDALEDAVAERDATLLPWLPLIATVLDVDCFPTPEVAALAPEFRKARLEDTVVRFLSVMLAEPTVVVIDDVHLMDDASVDLLARICRTVARRPWLVVVMRREAEEGFHPDEAAHVVQLRPGPLEPGDLEQLARRHLEDTTLTPEDVASLTRRAGGNPLFLRGLVLAARTGARLDGLPETLEGLITSQIDRLPPDERTLLRFASVLGAGFHESELRALMVGHRLPTRPDALRRLSYFIRQEGHGRYRFDHQLIRDTAYEGLPYRLRRTLHGRAGEVIEANAAAPDEVAELLSFHYLHAARMDKAWDYSRLAGLRARDKYAYAQAEELLERATTAARALRDKVDSRDLVDVEVALGEARFRLGRNDAALASYQAARRRMRDEPVRAALLHKEEASIYYRQGRHAVALRSITRGLRLIEPLGTPPAMTARSRLEGAYAVVRENQGRYRDALRWARLAEQHAEDCGDPAALADALEAVHGALSMLGRESDRAYGEEALALYEQVGDRVGQSRALNNLAVHAWINGRGGESLEMFRRAEVLAQEAGDTGGAAATSYNVGDVLVRLGRSDEAVDLLRGLLPVLAGLGVEDFHAAARRALGLALVLQGERAEGDTLLSEARAALDALGEPAEVVETDAAIAYSLLLDDRATEAEALARDACERAVALDAGYLLPWSLRLHGAALADSGRLDEALEVLDRALESADAQSRVDRGFVLAELAHLARRRDDEAGCRKRQDEAEAAFVELGYVGGPRYPRPFVA
jgi:class 3 adenylate cyclase/tetratricopeptide (TPR) repeat protein